MNGTFDNDLATLRDKARLKMDPHAISRMATLRVSEHEVLTTVLHPQRVLRSGPGHPPDRVVYCNGAIRVVVGCTTRVVITICLDSHRPYVHGRDTRPGPISGPHGPLPMVA